jgi:hypothetical protein
MKFTKKINLKNSREKFFKDNKNFIFLITKRFNWMKKYIKNKNTIIEVGSGNCLIKNILSNKIICTDIFPLKNLSKKLDMDNFSLNKKFKKKVDIFIFNHSLHHSSNPQKLLKIISKNYLKKNGHVLINEPEISYVFRAFLTICDHEGYDLNIENRKKRLFWRENNATGRHLFGKKKINDSFLNYKIKKNTLNECLVFLNSSGNGVDAPHIRLNNFFLKIIDVLDFFLVKLSPSIFALNRSIVLKNTE